MLADVRLLGKQIDCRHRSTQHIVVWVSGLSVKKMNVTLCLACVCICPYHTIRNQQSHCDRFCYFVQLNERKKSAFSDRDKEKRRPKKCERESYNNSSMLTKLDPKNPRISTVRFIATECWRTFCILVCLLAHGLAGKLRKFLFWNKCNLHDALFLSRNRRGELNGKIAVC